MKKVLTWLVALLLVVAVLPMPVASAACAHNNQDITSSYFKYTKYSSSQHTATCYVTWSCLDCGTVLIRNEAWYSEEEAHTFSSNKCTKCGYTKSCSHADAYISSSRYTYRKLTGNASYHEVTCYNTWKCRDCGKITINDEAWYTEEQPHQFSSNKCTQCGYVRGNSCSHSDHKSTPFGEIEYTPISGGTSHSVERHYVITCEDCGKEIDSDYVGHTTEAHSFNYYDKCTKCGYSKSGGTTTTTSQTSGTEKQTNDSGFYVKSSVSFVRGGTTIYWVDSGNNGPYEITYRQDGIPTCYGDSWARFYVDDIWSKQVTIYDMVPGCSYRVYIDDSEGNRAEATVSIPTVSAFADGKIKPSSITVDVEYSYRPSLNTPYRDAEAIHALYAYRIENGLQNGEDYGVRYTIHLPQLAYERRYHTMIVFRAPNGYAIPVYSQEYTYPRYNNSTGQTYWYCLGREFFSPYYFNYRGIPSGEYYIDLYWDGMWVDTSSFYIY